MSHPESIFLQVCDDAMSEWCGEVTWCDFRVHDDDVKYIRADLVEQHLYEVTKQPDELLEALLSRLVTESNVSAGKQSPA